MKSRLPHAFTLVELLVVITIIAILAGLTVSTMGYANRTAAKKRAAGEIAALSTALESYYTDNGIYPAGTNGDPASNSTPKSGNEFLIEALQPETGKVYFEFPKNMTNGSNVVDPFGEQYGYRYPGDTNTSGSNFFDLWSRAGTTNSNDWIKNW